MASGSEPSPHRRAQTDSGGGLPRAERRRDPHQHSHCAGNSSAGCGGRIHIANLGPAALTLKRSAVTGNFGNQGGGISASCEGNAGPVKIIESAIAGNDGDADENLNGYGGIYLQTSSSVQSVIQGSTFSRNTSGLEGIGQADGGGIYTDLGSLRLVGSTISGNRSGDTGGGIYVDGTEPAAIVNSTITKNRANANGGGIQMAGGEVSLNGVSVVRNRGNADGVLSEAGGGISNDDPNFTVRNSLIALNTLAALTPGDPPVKNDCSASIRSILSATPALDLLHLRRLRRARRLQEGEPEARPARERRRPRPSRSRPEARRSARPTSRARPGAISAAASAIESPTSGRSSARRFRPRADAGRARGARRSAPTTPPR